MVKSSATARRNLIDPVRALLCTGLLLALLAASVTAAQAQTVATVRFSNGLVTATGTGLGERALTRGSELEQGDKIITGADGRAQLAFVDGSVLALYENTDLTIDEFVYSDGSGDNESAVFTMLAGGVRALTGGVGSQDQSDYGLNTPVGTIGIRGTGWLATLNQVLEATVAEGEIFMANDAGSIDVPSGQTGQIIAPNVPPQIVAGTPFLPPPAPNQNTDPVDTADDPVDAEVADQVNDDGQNTTLATFIAESNASGSGDDDADDTNSGGSLQVAALLSTTQALSSAQSSGGEFELIDDRSGTNVIQNETTGTLESITLIGGDENGTLGIGTARQSDTSGNANITIGRWHDGTLSGTHDAAGEAIPENGGFHFAVGVPVTNMPTSGSATYSLVGATSPTFADGALAPGTFTARQDVTVNFGSTPNINYQFQAAMPGDATYQWQASGVSIGTDGRFSHQSAFTNPGGRACPTTGVSCQALTHGFLGGDGATIIGFAYMLQQSGDSDAGTNISGAAHFGKN